MCSEEYSACFPDQALLRRHVHRSSWPQLTAGELVESGAFRLVVVCFHSSAAQAAVANIWSCWNKGDNEEGGKYWEKNSQGGAKEEGKMLPRLAQNLFSF